MRQMPILALLGAGLLNTGCGDLLSLHSLYTAQDDVVDPALEGKWENKEEFVIVERATDCYLVLGDVKLLVARKVPRIAPSGLRTRAIQAEKR
ncbi:MAG: hypothetical protein JJE04_13470 [Acidobacteriia bacterium]|nr:hypothetical protein [Terriglobia bacterium]